MGFCLFMGQIALPICAPVMVALTCSTMSAGKGKVSAIGSDCSVSQASMVWAALSIVWVIRVLAIQSNPAKSLPREPHHIGKAVTLRRIPQPQERYSRHLYKVHLAWGPAF